MNYEVGDILVSYYSYNSVIYNFYKVVRVTDKSIWLQELGKYWHGTQFHNPVTPNESHVGKVFRKRKSDTIYVDDYSWIIGKYDEKSQYAEICD